MIILYIPDLLLMLLIFIESYISERIEDEKIRIRMSVYTENCTLDQEPQKSSVLDPVDDKALEYSTKSPVFEVEAYSMENQIPLSITELDSSSMNLLDTLISELEQVEGIKESDNLSLTIHDAAEAWADTVDTEFFNVPCSRIADNLHGPQQWVVNVIGTEQEYIHVSDGKRIWINVGPQRAQKLNLGDVLVLDVVKEEKNIEVTNLFRLEAGVSDEYVIPDEELCKGEKAIAV